MDDLTWAWDTETYAYVWNAISNAKGIPAFRVYSGVADYFIMQGPWANVWANGYCKKNLSLTDISDNWRKDKTVAPTLYSCVGGSHAKNGVGMVFVDGSARFVPSSEVLWMPGSEGHLMSTHYKLSGNLHLWAKERGTISSPR